MSARETFKFQLYVAGSAQNSAQAATNLDALCRDHLSDCHDIEIVDVYLEPERALAEGIFMTPTLIKLAPIPAPLRIVGTLSERLPLMHALGLDNEAPSA